MEEIIKALRNRIDWIEKEKDKLTEYEKGIIRQNLTEINTTLKRCMLTHFAINK